MTRWCESKTTSLESVLDELGISKANLTLREIEAEEYAAAEIRIANCPVEMGGPGHMELLYFLTKHLNSTQIIETGVAYGWSSFAFISAMKERQGARLWSIDMPYVDREGASYVGIAVPEAWRKQWTLLRMPDRAGIPRALGQLKGKLDIAHYDSDKSYIGRAWALPKLWEAIRPGGYLIVDDINDNRQFRHFVENLAIEPRVLAYQTKYVGLLQKP